jgi:(1->4)-alpha-D-glucan 1-alpha-D-glucosylmutase
MDDAGWSVGERGTDITPHRPLPTASPPLFIEKILAYGEELRESWLVDGTTGYDFLNDVEDLFLAPDGAQTIERDYRRIRRLGQTTFRDVARAAKRAALAGPLRGDLDRVAALAEPLAAAEKRPVDRKQLATAIAELIASISVYRTYLDGRNEPPEADRAVLERAVADVRRRAPQFAEIAQFVVSLMLDRGDAGGLDRRLEFTFRFQQLSAPASAKGVEDTALYLYVPLVSRNEVGGGPDRDLTCAIAHFHEANTRRAEHWPLGLTATTTHDTKRSADVRSRLDALSEVPHDWERTVHRWRRLNTRHRVTVRGRLAPDTNTEYLLYQTLVALWPAPRAGRRSDDLPDRTWRDSARERLEEYIVKAAREAKTRTSWTNPDAGYEAALRSFVRAILTPGEDAPFLADVARIVARIAAAGAWNALSRMVLHMSSPGTPDTYQGDEIWNFVLVDPDNRRPVDYKSRQAALDALLSFGSTREKPRALDPFDSRTKLLVLHRLLSARRERADLFSRGNYRPLDVVGPRASHVVAFLRSHQDQHAICIGGRILCELDVNQNPAVWWQDTKVLLPPDIGGGEDLPWRSAIDGTEVRVSGALPLGLTLTHFPGALIVTA